MASEIADHIRQQKLKDAENEISQENLVRPSELLARQRKNSAKNHRKSPPKENSKEIVRPIPKNRSLSSIEDLSESNNGQNSVKTIPLPQTEPEVQESEAVQEAEPVQEHLREQRNEIIENNSSQPEIEIPKEIPKTEPGPESEDPSRADTKEYVENNSPEVINDPSPAVIKSTKDEVDSNSQNSTQNMSATTQDEPITAESTPAKPPRTPSTQKPETPKSSDDEIKPDHSSSADQNLVEDLQSPETKSETKPEPEPSGEDMSESKSKGSEDSQKGSVKPTERTSDDIKSDTPESKDSKSSSNEKIQEEIEEKPGNGVLKREDNRKSKRISNKKPNYKDKVWRNISCLATEVDELERHSPTPPKQKRKNRKSFCTLQ